MERSCEFGGGRTAVLPPLPPNQLCNPQSRDPQASRRNLEELPRGRAEICPLCPPPAQDARGDAAGGYGEPLKIPAPERGSYKYPQPFRKGAGG